MSTSDPTLNEPFAAPRRQRDAATLGMWTFLATEVLFFGVLFASYTIARVRFPDAFAEGSRHTDMLLGTIETAVLLTSSCFVALALRAIELGERRAAKWLVAATAAFGVAFLVMHGFEYRSEYEEGLVPALRWTQTGPLAHAMEMFFFLYYAITGLHSLHVAIGVVMLSVLGILIHRGHFDREYSTPLEIGALYWHFVDIVWIFVYPLIYLVGRAS